MNPNHFLSASIAYLHANRPNWNSRSAVGKTVVSSSMIDRLTAKLGRALVEMPVGFKWFSGGLGNASLIFAGEESAGASFLRRDGSVWTTDKDGLIMGLLAAEITAREGDDPQRYFEAATKELGQSFYRRVDVAVSLAQKQMIENIDTDEFDLHEVGGEPVRAKLTRAPGNDKPIGGIKVVTESGWSAVRPSGTEQIYKIYAESFRSEAHLNHIVADAHEIVSTVLLSDAKRPLTTTEPLHRSL